MIKIYLCPGFVDKCYPDRGTLFLKGMREKGGV
jgi:hypothetical protein